MSTDSNEKCPPVFGMAILKDNVAPNFADFSEHYKQNFEDELKNISIEEDAFSFTIDDELVIVAHASYPIPFDDIEYTAKYAYNWRSAVNDIKDHQSHAFITIMPGGNDQVKRFRIFTKVASSLLGATNSIGIYMGNQTLLLPTEGYIEEVRSMDNDSLPINLWIYIGLRENKSNSGRVYGSGYTYGLKEFNKSEIEIVHSTKDIVEIRDLLYDIVHYVLKNDVTLNDGDTGGHTEEEKIKITYSQGVFVDDMTFKIEY